MYNSGVVDYKKVYNKNYFLGKNSFFWKGGYGKYWGLASFYFNNLYRPLKPYLTEPTGGNLLDVGCAYGIMLSLFPSKFHKYGIDVSDYAIRVAKTRDPRARFTVCDAEKAFSFPKNFFDLIICNDVLEHLENPVALLKNVFRVLKAGGLFYLTTPNLNSFRKIFLAFPDKEEHHLSLISHQQLLSLLAETNFSIKSHWTFSNTLFYLRYPGNWGIESAFILSK